MFPGAIATRPVRILEIPSWNPFTPRRYKTNLNCATVRVFPQRPQRCGARLIEATHTVKISSLSPQPHRNAPCTWVFRIYSCGPHRTNSNSNATHRMAVTKRNHRRTGAPRSTCCSILGALGTRCFSSPHPRTKLRKCVHFRQRTPSCPTRLARTKLTVLLKWHTGKIPSYRVWSM